MTPTFNCHRCGYDLRATPADAACPECNEPVAASRAAADVPLRPAWRDSDPAWRRRILAGLVALLGLPTYELLARVGWSAAVPAPLGSTFIDTSIDGMFFPMFYIGPWVAVGLALLLARERGCRRRAADRLRPWGLVLVAVVLAMAIADWTLL